MGKPSVCKMSLNAKTLQTLFITLSKKKLQALQLSLCPTLDESTSEEELEQLQHSFTKLLENSSELYYLGLEIKFKEGESTKEIGVNVFKHLPKFIASNKAKIETFSRFSVHIQR